MLTKMLEERVLPLILASLPSPETVGISSSHGWKKPRVVV